MGSTFDFQAACNSISHFLEEMVVNNSVRLSFDINIPNLLEGDDQGFRFSIIHISRFLNRHLVGGKIIIEILKLRQEIENMVVKIGITGTEKENNAWRRKTSMGLNSKLEWVKKMPYKTSVIHHTNYYFFSFEMTFICGDEIPSSQFLFLSGKRILIVDDNDINAFVCASFLEEWGCTITRVPNGKEALNFFPGNKFDAILMDSYMPEMNGNQVTKKIRVWDAHIPIIAMIASSLEREMVKAISAGANDFLLKPISSTHLKSVLKKQLKLS